MLFASLLAALASGCAAPSCFSGSRSVPVTKTLKMSVPGKVAFVIWSVVRRNHCSVQVASPDAAGVKGDLARGEAPAAFSSQVQLLKSDGTAIPQAQAPVRLNFSTAGRSYVLAIYDFTSSGCASAASVSLKVDDQVLVEPLTSN
jgi:hypothetical protein